VQRLKCGELAPTRHRAMSAAAASCLRRESKHRRRRHLALRENPAQTECPQQAISAQQVRPRSAPSTPEWEDLRTTPDRALLKQKFGQMHSILAGYSGYQRAPDRHNVCLNLVSSGRLSSYFMRRCVYWWFPRLLCLSTVATRTAVGRPIFRSAERVSADAGHARTQPRCHRSAWTESNG
jgi:hypothetical protein